MNKLKQIIDMLQDEKIIEEIIGFIQWAVDRGSITEKQREKSDLWITWLEKRAEQKTVSKTEPIIEGLTTEFQKQVSHLIASAINKEHEYNEGFVKWAANALLNYAKQELEKQGEQKYAWNQDDEIMLNSIIATCELAEQDSDSSPARHLLEMQVNWLKSLKERYTWKPSDEQMEALLKLEEMHVLEHEKNQENAHLYMVIKSLREQLLKLKKGE